MLKKANGFSLVEVLMAFGMLGVVAFIATNLFDTGLKGQKTTESAYEIVSLTSEIRNLLANPIACQKTFGGLNPVDAPLVLNSLKKKDGSDKYIKDQTYGNNNLKLTGITLERYSGDAATLASPQGTAKLNVTLQKPQKTLGLQEINKSFEVQINLVGNGNKKISSCIVVGSPQDFATKEYVDAATATGSEASVIYIKCSILYVGTTWHTMGCVESGYSGTLVASSNYKFNQMNPGPCPTGYTDGGVSSESAPAGNGYNMARICLK